MRMLSEINLLKVNIFIELHVYELDFFYYLFQWNYYTKLYFADGKLINLRVYAIISSKMRELKNIKQIIAVWNYH